MNYSHDSVPFFIGTSAEDDAIFFSTQTSIYNKKPPVTVITGKPGSGKTFFSSILAINSVFSGTRGIILDFKGDFLSLAAALKDDVPNLKVLDLSQQENGILDPFQITSNIGETITLAKSVLNIFLGQLSKEEENIIDPLIKDVAESNTPSLLKVIKELQEGESEISRSLANRLKYIRNVPRANVCFANKNVNKGTDVLGLSPSLTIITFLGLDLPSDSTNLTKPEDRFSVGVMYLVLSLIRGILNQNKKDKYPHMLLIDEAWVVLNSDMGKDLINSFALLGRSLNISTVIATQNNSHIAKADIKNTISTRFIFACNKDEAESVINDVELPDKDDYLKLFTEELDSDGPGRCVMKDIEGRFAIVDTHLFMDELAEKLSTTPTVVKKHLDSSTEEY